MHQKLFCLFLFLITISESIVASIDHPLAKAETIITSEAAPSSIVNGTVNAIEGTFSFSSFGLSVPGQESIHVIHHYSNKSRYASWLGTGMSINYSFSMAGKTFADKEKDKHNKYSHMNAEAAGGSIKGFFYMHQYQRLFKILESNLPILLLILHNYISNEYENELKEFLYHGEYGLVYEDLCEMIALYKIPISQENFNLISKLGQLMEYDEKQWIALKDFIEK